MPFQVSGNPECHASLYLLPLAHLLWGISCREQHPKDATRPLPFFRTGTILRLFLQQSSRSQLRKDLFLPGKVPCLDLPQKSYLSSPLSFAP